MVSLEEKLQKWIVNEGDGLCEGRMTKIPAISTLLHLKKSKNKKVWKYFIEHVKSRQSVENIRNILRLRKGRTDLNHIYPPTLRSDTLALKQEIVNSQEKVQFVEDSLKSIKSHILSCKDSVQELKTETCILSQKFTFLELVYLNYREKNEALKINLEHLHLLLNYVFCNKKTIPCQELHSGYSIQTFNLYKHNFETNNAEIKYVLNQILGALENKLIKNEVGEQLTNWKKLVSELSCCISLNDVIHILKELSRQSEKALKAEDVVSISTSHFTKEEMSSKKYLQKLKFEHVESCFLKTKVLEDTSNLPSFDKEQANMQILQKVKNPVHQELLLVKSENESLMEVIVYLENILADVFNKTKYLNCKNDEQRSHCKHLKSVIQEFYRKLEILQVFLDASQQTFLNIQKALLASNEFMFTILFDSMTSGNIKFLSDSTNQMKFDFEISMKVMEKKEYLQPLFKESCFNDSSIPETVWESVTMPVYQNRLLICEKLNHLKKEISDKKFVLGTNIDMEEKLFEMLSQLQSILNHSKATEEKYVEEIRKCRKNLEITIKEWWEQDAQFIPVINYQGKSLNMWLDVLHVLELLNR